MTGDVKEKIVDVDEHIIDLCAKSGYSKNVDLLAECRDTGNGLIFFFPSYSRTEQANYICMNYSEAACIYKILRHKKKKGDL